MAIRYCAAKRKVPHRLRNQHMTPLGRLSILTAIRRHCRRLSQNLQVNPVPSGLALSQEMLRFSGETSGVQIVAQVSNPTANDLQLIVEFNVRKFTAFFP